MNELNDSKIRLDRMRYKKDALPYAFVLLGLLFNVFYFFKIYGLNDNFFFKPIIGVSIIYNLLFLLAVFLSAEEIKAYKRNYNFIVLGISALQVARIFILPLRAFNYTTTTPTKVTEIVNGEEVTKTVDIITKAMEQKDFIWSLAFLAISALLLAAGAIISLNNIKKLNTYKRELALERGELCHM